MPLTRSKTWETRELPAFITAHKNVPFAWGGADCCLLAADAVLAITGTDIASDFRGKYTDQASALVAIRSIAGGTTVADAAAYCAGKHDLVEWPHPLQAQRGDLVVIQDAGGLIAGFVHPTGRFAMSIGEAGLKFLPLSQVKRAWKV